MEKLRIFILNASAIYGGGEYYTYQLALNLVKRGHYAVVGCRKNNLLYNKCASLSIPLEIIDFGENGNENLIKNISYIKSLINKHNIQILHTNTVTDRTQGAFAAYRAGVKHVTSCHSLLSTRRNITHYLRNRKLTDAFIADGITIKELLVNKDKIDPAKVHIISNGIVAGEMKRDEAKRKQARESFGIKESDIVVGSAARLVYFKGHKYLLNAMAIQIEKNSNVKLMITGDGELLKELMEYARILKIADNVIFTGFSDDLQSIYSAYDIYAHPSIEGGGELLPYSVLYAMAQALPITATEIGDMPYMIENGKSGFIVKEKSAVELSDKIGLLVNDAALREKFGGEAYKRLLENFTIERTIDKTESLYYKVIQG